LKFGLAAETGERTCIVVVEAKLASARVAPMGLAVDRVEEVAHIASTDIEPTPHPGADFDGSCLLGLAKVKSQVKLLLDIDRVVAAEMIESVARAA
jgi:purine-binding chemotaxis protein CheW